MNRILEKGIKAIESKKQKKLIQKGQLDQEINSLDEELKPLYELKRTEEKIANMQKELEEKIKQIRNV